MNAERWRQVQAMFDEAIEMPPGERTAFLETATADTTLRSEVRSMIVATEQAGDLLEAPVLGGVAGIMAADQEAPVTTSPEAIGARVGQYKLVDVIASGGMGTVYLAVRTDDEYRQNVAIKLIRKGLRAPGSESDDSLVRRFRHERQVLAGLEHPFIARLLDGGATDDDRPYYVMEYVEGTPIDAYCRDRPIEACLDLFDRVCSAVEYAHRKLVIHRDLKPGNIHVQADGTPKLLDFGLAKLLDPHHPTGSATLTGAFMGTFAYASPEQISAAGSEIDVRCDVYALGVLLYRIVAGQHPYSVEGSMAEVLDTITRVIPSPPSTHRRLDPDLDTIVMAALAKDPERRYQSVADLRQDLRHLRSHEPILARGDSRLYKLKKNAQRYRYVLGAAAAFVMLIVAFAVSMAVQASRIATERDHAVSAQTSLARALRLSRLERGISLATTGNPALAEDLLWSLHLESDRAQVGGADSFWALWGLYFNEPCLETFRLDAPDGLLARTSAMNGDRTLLAMVADEDVAIHNFEDGTERRWDLDHVADRLDLSPDGSTVLSADPDGRLHALDTRSGRQRSFRAGRPGINVIQIVPHQNRVVTTTEGTIAVWTLEEELTLDFEIDRRGFGPVGLSRDGTILACYTGPANLAFWDLDQRTQVADISTRPQRSGHLVFSGDGTMVAVGGEKSVPVYDWRRQREVTNIADTGGRGEVLAFGGMDRGEQVLAVGSTDRSIRLWAIPSGRLITEFNSHRGVPRAVWFTPDNEQLISVDSDGIGKRWETRPQAAVTRVTGHRGTVFTATLHPSGTIVATGSGDQDPALRLWDADTGVFREIIGTHPAHVVRAVFVGDGSRLLSAAYDGVVRLWDVSSGTLLRAFDHGSVKINDMAVHPDGRRAATVAEDGRVVVLDLATGEMESVFHLADEALSSIDIAPDGESMIVAARYDRSIHRITFEGTRLWRVDGHRKATRMVRWAPDGTTVASGGDDRVVRLWSADGEHLVDLEGHGQDVFALAFSPDGTLLASGSRGGEVTIWDLVSRRRAVTMMLHDGMVFSVEFDADGRRLITCGSDRTAAILDLGYYRRHIEGNIAFQRSRSIPGHE